MHDDSLVFDEWKTLAESDPHVFEQRRQQVISQFISSISGERQQRLRRLQWRIDMERHRCANPVKATLRLYTMMWDSVYGEHGMLPSLEVLTGRCNPPVRKSAEILAFRKMQKTG